MNNGGILLCGGAGTRLFPTTSYINKHLIPVYDKPMIYYSLSILFLSGIKNITIVCNEKDLSTFKSLLGDGEQFGVQFNYSVQESPDGIPHAIDNALLEEAFDKFVVVLGDNFVFGEKFFTRFEQIFNNTEKCAIFSQIVKNPENFGVVELDNNKNIKSLVEKPKKIISNKAVIGLYIFDSEFSNHFTNIKKSKRNEYEITDLVSEYGLENVDHIEIGRGTAWFDMGSFESFYNCSSFVKTIQDRLGLLICSPHEIAFNNGWITKTILKNYIKKNKNSDYSNNLKTFLNEK